MKATVELSLDDQLAWFDCAAEIQYQRASWLIRVISGRKAFTSDREAFQERMLSEANRYARGVRSIELTTDGVTESVGPYIFTSPWSDLEFWHETSTHIFIVHKTMNSHIVPKRCLFDAPTQSDFRNALSNKLKAK